MFTYTVIELSFFLVMFSRLCPVCLELLPVQGIHCVCLCLCVYVCVCFGVCMCSCVCLSVLCLCTYVRERKSRGVWVGQGMSRLFRVVESKLFLFCFVLFRSLARPNWSSRLMCWFALSYSCFSFFLLLFRFDRSQQLRGLDRSSCTDWHRCCWRWVSWLAERLFVY